MHRFIACLGLFVTLLALAGCDGYRLQGRVVAGEVSYIEVVDKDDPRLSIAPPIGGVSVGAVIDPGSLDREDLGTVTTAPDGSFSIPISSFGAGLLEYEVGVRARRGGFATAEHFFPLPSDSKRLLVTLAPGRDDEPVESSPFDSYDYRDDLERFGR